MSDDIEEEPFSLGAVSQDLRMGFSLGMAFESAKRDGWVIVTINIAAADTLMRIAEYCHLPFSAQPEVNDEDDEELVTVTIGHDHGEERPIRHSTVRH